ncbi:MAG: MarR family transcriptional regulator [Pseudomonadota bacterium]|jgi:MarR family transcriptional regulator for hemolysin
MDRQTAERALPIALLQLNRLYRHAIDRTLAPLGLSDARALPLLYMARDADGLRQGVLADALGMEGPSLVRLLDHLCFTGLVERRVDPKDARAKTVHLTAAGRKAAAECLLLLDEVRKRLLAEVSDADLSVTMKVLAMFQAKLEAARAGEHGLDPS